MGEKTEEGRISIITVPATGVRCPSEALALSLERRLAALAEVMRSTQGLARNMSQARSLSASCGVTADPGLTSVFAGSTIYINDTSIRLLR